MTPQEAASRTYNLALRQNPQCVTYLQRIAASNPGDSDTFTAYQLSRAVSKDIAFDEKTFGNSSVSDSANEWTLFKLDLLNAGVPCPLSPQLTYAIGDRWAGTRTGTLTADSKVVTGIDTSEFVYGMACVGRGIPNFTKIFSVSGNTITLDKAATASGTVSLAFGDWWLIQRVDNPLMDAFYRCQTTRGR